MNRSPLKLLLSLILAVGVFVFLNKQFFNNKISFSFLPRYGQEKAAYIFNKLSVFRKIVGSIRTNSALIDRNIKLEERNNELVALLSEIETLKKENEFLKKNLNISDKIGRELEFGSIYSWSLNPNGYSVLLNKGKKHGILPGNIVIANEKVLIGTVEKVEDNFSQILTINDPKFKITARILGSNILA